MIPDKTKTLMNRLMKLTEAGSLVWDTTSRNTEFTVQFSSGTITTDKWADSSDGTEFIDLVIYNADGVAIETLRYCKEDSPGWYNEIECLYNAIHRKYLRVDETLDGILQEMEDIGIDY